MDGEKRLNFNVKLVIKVSALYFMSITIYEQISIMTVTINYLLFLCTTLFTADNVLYLVMSFGFF